METEIEAGIADIKVGNTDHYIQAGLQFALAATQIPEALKTCEGMTDDLNAIEQWASIFKDPAKLAKKLALHYATHKAKIQTDIHSLEADWDSDLYFKAGQDLADIATLAIGPIETELGAGFECNMNTSEVAYMISGFMKSFTGWNNFQYLQTCFKDTP